MKKHLWLYATGVLCVVHICLNMIWIMHNEDFMGFDVFEHLTRQERLYAETKAILALTEPLEAKIKDVLYLFFRSPYSHSQFPGFVYLITIIQKLIFGDHWTLPFLANSFYLLMLLFSTYAVGALCANGFIGFLAAFILSTSPEITGIVRYYGLDYPLMAFFACSFLILLKTEYFQKIRYTLLLAVFCIIGILIKGQFVFFIVPSMSVFFFFALRQKKLREGNLIILSVISCFVVLFITYIWWEGRVKELLHILWTHLTFFYAGESPSLGFIARHVFFYGRTMVLAMFPFYFLLAVWSLYYVFRKYATVPIRGIFWVSISTYLVFTLISAKNARYLYPIYFGYAILVAYCICGLAERRTRRIVLVSIFIIGSVQTVVMSFGPKPIYSWIRTNFVNRIRGNDRSEIWIELPRSSNTRAQVRSMARHIEGANKNVLILNDPFADLTRSVEFEYFLRHANPSLIVNSSPWWPLEEMLMSADYLIFNDNSIYAQALIGARNKFETAAADLIYEHRDDYAVLWVGEWCASYGEPLKMMVLAKKIV
ncbi:MAG: glycosyltransferase family 39 protein [Candidatus Omnitrophica bacterium]|nr:glycosyltransferase family 39 protein [Candidatus Omnitrophota bacterium]